MNDKKKGLLFQTKKQMNNGAIATGLGFGLYLVLLVLGLELPADLVAIAFSVVGIFNSLSVLEGRRNDHLAGGLRGAGRQAAAGAVKGKAAGIHRIPAAFFLF